MVYMKKFICSLASSVIALSAHAVWLPSDRDNYFDTMLENSLTNQTYVKVLDMAGTVEVVKCLGEYYEHFYTYDQWLFIWNEGNETTLDEFYGVQYMCVQETLHTQKQIASEGQKII